LTILILAAKTRNYSALLEQNTKRVVSFRASPADGSQTVVGSGKVAAAFAAPPP
jgi:hypothetical protein